MDQSSRTLASRMGISTLVLILGLLLLAGTAMWGLYGIDDSLIRALTAYDRLKATYDVALSVQRAREMLDRLPPDRTEVVSQLRDATKKLYELPLQSDQQMIGQACDALVAAQRALDDRVSEDGIARAIGSINHALDAMNHISATTRQEMAEIDGERWVRKTSIMVTLGAVSLVVVTGAILIGLMQYRSVIGPLRRLGEGVTRLKGRRFDAPLAVHGDAEFAQLAEEFNRMAAELDGFYRSLEEKVDAKSRELIRSERLASMGFLAAGVAHEINNPLAIISGHAELAERGLSRVTVARSAEVEDATRSLRVIAEEAIRCKEITGKLLGLIRGGDRDRVTVNVQQVSQEVSDLVAGLPRYRGRRVSVRCEEGLQVSANQVELKQVLLNLVVNALEATADFAATVAVVEINARGMDGFVELTVSDNGRGMAPEVLAHVFEPFFTAKRGSDGRPSGIGLGLAVTHAIVETHGGQIRAESHGPGTGSRFIMEWPRV